MIDEFVASVTHFKTESMVSTVPRVIAACSSMLFPLAFGAIPSASNNSANVSLEKSCLGVCFTLWGSPNRIIPTII